jgi:hypothetical protein
MTIVTIMVTGTMEADVMLLSIHELPNPVDLLKEIQDGVRRKYIWGLIGLRPKFSLKKKGPTKHP